MVEPLRVFGLGLRLVHGHCARPFLQSTIVADATRTIFGIILLRH